MKSANIFSWTDGAGRGFAGESRFGKRGFRARAIEQRIAEIHDVGGGRVEKLRRPGRREIDRDFDGAPGGGQRGVDVLTRRLADIRRQRFAGSGIDRAELRLRSNPLAIDQMRAGKTVSHSSYSKGNCPRNPAIRHRDC